MFDQKALAYLKEHLSGYEEVISAAARVDIRSPLIAVPATSKIESLEQFQDAPNAIKQVAELKSCSSFCLYVNRFKNDHSTVYLNVDGGKFDALLDHHGKDAPAWGRHRAWFKPKLSLQWQTWVAAHGKPMLQVVFAQLIEERLDDIVKPEPNAVLKAALEFQQNDTMEFASSQNLDNGNTRYTFKKDAATNTIEFPHRVTLSIPLHENEAKKALEARIRTFVTANGQLTFTFSFVKNPAMVVREALVALADQINENVEGIAVYEGALP